MADNLAESVVLAAADAEFRAAGPGRCEMAVGPRTYTLAMAPDVLTALGDVVAEVVPALRRTVPAGDQLSPADVERLAPFVESLLELEVLMTPDAGTVVEDEAAWRLYTYVRRRAAADPDRVFAELRARRVRVVGPPEFAGLWAGLLREQGLDVAEPEGSEFLEAGVPSGGLLNRASVPDLTIVVSCEEEELAAANRWQCAARAAWLPVLVGAQSVRVGPWVRVGESACLACFVSGTDAGGRARPPGARTGWATFSPAGRHWVGGLIGQQALRALLPMGAEHPWGRVVTVEVVACEQASTIALRDPFCAECAEHAPASQEWTQP